MFANKYELVRSKSIAVRERAHTISLKNNSVSHPKRSHRRVSLYKQADFHTDNATLQCLPISMFSADDVNNFWAEC